MAKSFAFLLLVLALPATPPAAAPAVAETSSTESAATLAPRHQRFLEEVAPLISDSEREVFFGLTKDYQRDAFIRRFWRLRDPFPRTSRNELQERWRERVALARESFGSLEGERVEMLLLFGPPSWQRALHCPELLHSLEVWRFNEGSDHIAGTFTLVFIGSRPGGPDDRGLWRPSRGYGRLLASGLTGALGAESLRTRDVIRRTCLDGEEILAALDQALDLERVKEQVDLVPQPGDEWARTFAAHTTDLEPGTEPLAASLEISYPGRHQSRTVVQGLISVPRQAATAASLGTYSGYSFIVDGEVLRQGELFEQFRYRFALPQAEAPADTLPLVIQRYLRPGPYTLILKAADQNADRAFRTVQEIEVPTVRPRAPATAQVAVRESADQGNNAAGIGAGPGASTAAGDPLAEAQLAEAQLAEANASIATGDQTLRILPLPSRLLVGNVRVEAHPRGDGIARVAFKLDGQQVLSKSRPPYSVELALGEQPQLHTLEAIALDAEGQVVARDETLINAGPHRFALRLIEPQPGKRYQHSVRAHAEVEMPEGEHLDRLELYRNQTLVATLYQPPFEQPILLPPTSSTPGDGAPLTFVRAVAYLDDGNSTEDVVFINAPDLVDEVDVQLVELFTSVTDRHGDFVDGLTADEFTVLEDGIEQRILRFEPVRDLPIHAGIVLDTSESMIDKLEAVERAAYHFLDTVITPRDRAAVITFSDAPHLAVRFTNDKTVLAGGLANLDAGGHTALFDSIIFAVHYFSGLKGKRAIIVLTDGEDSGSIYSDAEAIAFARHAGVAVYIIGLDLRSSAHESRLKMTRLARETGGETFFADQVSRGENQLDRIYGRIEQEIRFQYLIAYQSSQEGERFRRVEVEVARKGLEAKTIRGYVP